LKLAPLSTQLLSNPAPSEYHAREMAKSIACCDFMHAAAAAGTNVETSTPRCIAAAHAAEAAERRRQAARSSILRDGWCRRRALRRCQDSGEEKSKFCAGSVALSASSCEKW
jgi:hypothetical protein